LKIYNPPFEFLAEASKGAEIYKIDLLGDAGNGECSCPNYQYVKKPLLNKGHAQSSMTRCKHILQARNIALTLIIKAVNDEHGKLSKILDKFCPT